MAEGSGTTRPLAAFVATVLLFVPSSAVAEPAHVEAAGLLQGAAVLVIDGRQRMVRVGESSPEGCRVLQATPQFANVKCGSGPVRRLTLSNRAGGSYAPVARREVRIPLDRNGQYLVRGAVNGNSATMLVDTGATVVAISEREARRLGITVPANAPTGRVATAQGTARARQVILDRLEVGSISMPNVRAVVVDGAYPEQILLGMSFLSGVGVSHTDGVMVLTGR